MKGLKEKLVSLTSADLSIEQLKIDTIIDSMESRLLSKLVGEPKEVPRELEFVLLEVCVKRYNQIGDEGYSARSQEGESITLSSIFDEFEADIASWNKKNGESSNVGVWSMR